MTSWNGRGLPPEAERRRERLTGARVRGSMLSTAQTLSLESVGFRAVSEVMGIDVQRTVWPSYVVCNNTYGPGSLSVWDYPTTRADGINGAGPYLRSVRDGYRLALSRMREEAQSVRAHGIVGVRLNRVHVGEGLYEVTALGTAVRALSPIDLDRPFVTELSAHDVARLLLSGWVPVTTEVAVDLGIRHDDWNSRRQAYGGRWNRYVGEVDGQTAVITRTREFVRETMRRAVAASGADGVVVTAMRLRTFATEVAGHPDLVAEAQLLGTTVTRFGRASAPPPQPLTVIPLNRTRTRNKP